MSAGIPGDPGAVEAAAATLGTAGADLHDAATDISAVPRAIPSAWTGIAADSGVSATSRYAPAVDVGSHVSAGAQKVLHAYAQELRAAQQQYAAAEQQVAHGVSEGGVLALLPLPGPLAHDVPGADDVAAGRSGMAAAVARAERANQDAAGKINALVGELEAMRAAMPSVGPGSNPADPFTPGGPKPPPDGKSCAETLSCTVDDFQRMSIEERKRFMTEFIRLHGGRLGVQDRYNNVNGVLHFFTDDDLGKEGTWVSWVDASILHGIERGAATSMGLPGGDQGNPGGSRWKAYFDYVRRTGDNDSDTADRLWSQGEQASTHNGYDVAGDHGTQPSIPEAAFAGGGEIYRFGQRHEGVVKAGSGILFGPLGPEAVDDFLDPSNPYPSYLGGHVMHGGGSLLEGGGKTGLGLLTHNPAQTWDGITEQAGGAWETARYGGEGLLRGGGWVVDHVDLNPFN